MVSACLVSICISVMGVAPMDNSAAVRDLFANPTRDFACAPLWVWNDLITEDQITHSLEAFAAENVRQVFVHPRPGLMTPYMSDDWFRLWKHTLKEAERLDMNAWIYDENSYPSGFAGGLVPEAMPDARAKGLTLKPVKKPEPWHDGALAVYKKDGGSYRQITEDVKAGKEFPEGEYLVARLEDTKSSPWFGGWWYVDVLRPDVTQKFLEVTLEAYRNQFGGSFPERVPGSFTDEPHLTPIGDFHWTRDIVPLFQARWGYDLIDNLPSLVEPVGDWKKVRHNYYQLLLELFIRNWAVPYFDYCAKNNIEFTGHYWEHEWPNPKVGPDNMAMSAWQQRPGIDTLFNDPYDFGPHAQVGNTRAVVEIASVANQLGHTRTLCEAYGGSGWDMRFEDMKRIGDWLCVLGINTIDQHLAHITLRGARKRDYPPTFTYHEPWWNSFDISATYFARLSLALSKGRQVNKILLIEPTSSVWMYPRDQREQVGNQFQQLVHKLLAEQIEFDLGSEDVIARNGAVDRKGFVVGQRTYDTVVLPPGMENINTPALNLLEMFGKAGGRIIACQVPSLVDGAKSDLPAAIPCQKSDPGQLLGALVPGPGEPFVIRRAENKALLFHQRRVFDDGELLFLVNTSPDITASGAIMSATKGIEAWDLETGAIYGYPSTQTNTSQGKPVTSAKFDLPPAGSLLLFLSNKPVTLAPKPAPGGTPVPPAGQISATPTNLNVLTLDYVDVTAGGETKTGVPFKTAAQLAFQKNGMERDPWDHAVQFRDEFLKLTFPPDSGFTVTYRFNIDGPVPNPIYFVVERPDLYTIQCNGKPLDNKTPEWWLDRAFGRLDITSLASTGENTITLTASPFTVFHEIEAAFVLGDFALKPADKGFTIAAVSAPLALGPWNQQGRPLYGHGVTYTRSFDVPAVAGNYFVSLPDWYGSVANVAVNGQPAGTIYRQPYACDVTKFIKPGPNSLEVTVIGTLRNTLGPHHGQQRLGFASPGSWDKAPETGPPPGAAYDSVKYGLFKPFDLLQAK
ncbi:MAG: glycosyl hydrolase [Candidatus Hydrogenedentes bacterium]|nr:glycosyl hydrolase [Candidatus Hydrogenedentota bacterium]